MACVDDHFKAFVHVCKDPASGDVAVRFHKRNIVVVKKNGDIMLNTFGWYTSSTLSAMNEALLVLHIVVQHQGAVTDGSWAVTQKGRASVPYYDGMVITATDAAHVKRGDVVLCTYTRGAQVPAHVRTKLTAATAPGLGSRISMMHGKAGLQGQLHNHMTAGTAAVQSKDLPQQSDLTVDPMQQSGAAGRTLQEQLRSVIADMGLDDELEADEDSLCVVCLHRRREEVLVPCGHTVLCSECCGEVYKNTGECPLCRENIADHCPL